MASQKRFFFINCNVDVFFLKKIRGQKAAESSTDDSDVHRLYSLIVPVHICPQWKNGSHPDGSSVKLQRGEQEVFIEHLMGQIIVSDFSLEVDLQGRQWF